MLLPAFKTIHKTNTLFQYFFVENTQIFSSRISPDFFFISRIPRKPRIAPGSPRIAPDRPGFPDRPRIAPDFG